MPDEIPLSQGSRSVPAASGLPSSAARDNRCQMDGVIGAPEGGEIIKLNEDDGWYLVTTVGSHRQYKHPLKRGRVTIAGKLSAELPPGTERSVLRQAGLDRRTP